MKDCESAGAWSFSSRPQRRGAMFFGMTFLSHRAASTAVLWLVLRCCGNVYLRKVWWRDCKPERKGVVCDSPLTVDLESARDVGRVERYDCVWCI